jgi:hypothetical protein
MKVVIGTRVNETQQIFLSRRQGVHKIRASIGRGHLSTHKNSVSCRRGIGVLSILNNLEEGLIVPILKHDRRDLKIIIGRSRAMYDDRANYTVTVLTREMRMIPRCAILGGTKDIIFRLTRSKWAFCGTWCAVKDGGVELPDAMPVDLDM